MVKLHNLQPGRCCRWIPGVALGAAVGWIVKDLNLPGVASIWGSRAPWVPAFALVGAVLWSARGRGGLVGTALCLGVIWFVVAFTPLCSFLVRGLTRYDAPRPADAVFVFNSYMQDDGEPSSHAMGRLVRGVELLAQGLARRLIVSEFSESTDEVEGATRKLMYDLRIDGELLVVSEVANSHDEAMAVAALCRARGWNILLVVTSPLHSLRACATLENEGIEVICSPSVETHFNVQNLAEPDERLLAFEPILHEWLGLWVYRRRGWIAEN